MPSPPPLATGPSATAGGRQAGRGLPGTHRLRLATGPSATAGGRQAGRGLPGTHRLRLATGPSATAGGRPRIAPALAPSRRSNCRLRRVWGVGWGGVGDPTSRCLVLAPDVPTRQRAGRGDPASRCARRWRPAPCRPSPGRGEWRAGRWGRCDPAPRAAPGPPCRN